MCQETCVWSSPSGLISSFMLKAMNEGSWWSRCWRKLSTVDGSCLPWTEVALWTVNGSSLACYPPRLVKVKINFDEAQKLAWKEIICFYGLKKITTSNHISELLKMQLESKRRNFRTYSKGPVAGPFQNTLWPRRRASASEAAILASRAFAFVLSWFKIIIALSLCLSSGTLQHTVNTSIIAAKIV